MAPIMRLVGKVPSQTHHHTEGRVGKQRAELKTEGRVGKLLKSSQLRKYVFNTSDRLLAEHTYGIHGR